MFCFDEKSQPLVTISDADIPFKLSWTHYLILMKIQDKAERDFLRNLQYGKTGESGSSAANMAAPCMNDCLLEKISSR